MEVEVRLVPPDARPTPLRKTFEVCAAAALVVGVAWSLFGFPWVDDPENWTWCLRTGPRELRALTILWDAAIFTAYAWIPFSLVLTWLGLDVKPGGRLLILYGTFIVLCGFTHGVDGLNLWLSRPYYWVAMKIKAVTGAVSLAVAYVTETRRPDLLSLGKQGAALRAATATAERLMSEEQARADRLAAAQQEIEERALSENAARKQAEQLAADLATALEERNAKIEENVRLLQDLKVARDQATQRAQLAEGTVETIAAARDAAQRHAEELHALNETLGARERELLEANERLEVAAAKNRSQERAIAELSTPVIELDDGMLLLPIVGVFDSARALQIVEQSSATVTTRGAEIVIVDVTGVQVMDSGVVDAFVKLARVLALLGARCILTGIRGAVAQTMVEQGVEISGFVTKSTLKAGIREARVIAARLRSP